MMRCMEEWRWRWDYVKIEGCDRVRLIDGRVGC